MPYRRPGRNTSSFKTSARSARAPGTQRMNTTQLSNSRRHEMSVGAFPVPGSFPALAAGEYFGHILCRFVRTFSGSLDDTPPTATASNNFQSASVMNQSKITNFRAKISIKNRSNIGGFLGVYRVALSFWDAHIWNNKYTAECPVSMDTTTTGPPDLRGTVSAKAMSATLILKNNWNNFKGVQHYMEYLGDIQVPPEDGGNGGLIEIQLNGLPPKCRRSNEGMFYAYFFSNDSDQNGAETMQIDSTVDISFMETPSDNRIPFRS